MSSTATALRPAAAGISVLLALALLPGVAHAGVNLDKRIDVDLVNADMASFFQAFGELAGVRVALDPGLDAEQQVSIRLENVSARTVLAAACESMDCRWKFHDESLLIEPLPGTAGRQGARPLDELIDVKVTHAHGREVLSSIAQMLGADLSADESLAARIVSLELDRRSIGEALDTACAKLGCQWQLVAGEHRPLLRVQAGARPAPGSGPG
ncbi:MAG TPA: hypothetical protein VHQ90_03295 [Thermoanaerobaculia bacterium]|nr:hypothetical protein [Thermoanaerobaculia bacterium]